MKCKVHDKVLIISGKYKGKVGVVQRVLKKINKVIVEKVNIVTKHIKKSATRAGEIIKFEKPIDASNVMVVCPGCSKPVRVAYSVPQKGKKYRVCRKCNASLDKMDMKRKTRK